MTQLALELLRCPSCDGTVPLADAAQVPCPYCGAVVAIPPEYGQAVAAVRSANEARKSSEPHWAKLSSDAQGFDGLGMLMVVVLPPLVAFIASVIRYPPFSSAQIMTFAIIPSLLPGAAIWLWSTAVQATVMRFRNALGAAPPERAEGPPSCRQCSAPLATDAAAISATCDYCGADNVVSDITTRLGELNRELRDAVRTLAEATAKLRKRRTMIGLGVAGLVVSVGGASVVMGIAMFATV